MSGRARANTGSDMETPALPAAFRDAMAEMLGDECPAFLRALEALPALALRLNPSRPSAEAVAAPLIEGPVPWAPLGRYLRPDARPGASIAHWAGAYYVQEASAMVPAAVLDARPGEIVLDLCAAPGGKATQIAAGMGMRGALIANEPEPARARALAGHLERMGAANAIVVNALPDRLARRWPETFDAILVDAPCSGEGMFRRDPASRAEWRPASPAGCAARQAEILDRAAEMLKPGGRLVYSTCTFNRLENEATVEGFLRRHPDFSPWDFALDGLGSSTGGMLRVFPHRARGDGHFAARLIKAGAPSPIAPRRGGRPGRPDPGVDRLLAMLTRDVCDLPDFIRDMQIFQTGDRLRAVPAAAPSTEGLRVILPGLMLLRAGRSHVEPEHALAMALPFDCARQVAELDDAEAAAYLAGAPLPSDGAPGWALAAWRGLPLGWGKRAQGMLKNHLPRGLRRSVS